MKNFRHILSILIVGVSVIACESLDQEPYSNFSATEAYRTTDDLQNNLMGVYAPFRSGAYYGQNFVLSGELTTDNFIANAWNTNTYGDQHRWEIQSGTYQCRDLWNALYAVVTRANDVIDNADQITPKEGQDTDDVAEIIVRAKAEAHVARAIAYFDLIRVYAKPYSAATADDWGVPIVLHNPTDVHDAISKSSVGRSTIEEVYSLINSDLHTAIDKFNSLGGEVNATNNNRFSKYIAFAYLCRMHLYRGDQGNNVVDNVAAVDYADSTLTNAAYGFETQANYQNMWITDRSTKEFIWNVGVVGFESGNTALGGYYISDTPTQLPIPDYGPTENIIALIGAGNVRTVVSNQVMSLRNGAVAYVAYKYPGNPEFKTNTFRSNMPHVMRYAEVILNKAEALYYINQDQARAQLNALRTARGMATYPDNTNLLNNIRNERRIEFYAEGHRWHDLKRWHLGFTRTFYEPYGYQSELANVTIPADHYMFVWPIPQEEILNNVAISTQQNDGY